jgi:hypothetical protein
MMSAPTIAALESGELQVHYLLGARMRSMSEVRDRVLTDRQPYQESAPPNPHVSCSSRT